MHVIVDGRPVVDLHGGWRDEAQTEPWAADTVVNFYSVGKAIVALLALQQVDAGRIGLDDRLTTIWPEFGAGGKDEVTLRQALSHQGTVPAIHEPLTNEDLWDWDRMTAALAATDAWWVPGTRHAYHTNTYGFLVGEVVRRLTGDRPAARLRPLAHELDADLWFGLPTSEHHRCAEVIWAPGGPLRDLADLPDDLEPDVRMELTSYVNPPGFSSIGVVNTPAWRLAEVPSTNGHGTAWAWRASMQPSSSRGGCCHRICWPKHRARSRRGRARFCTTMRWSSASASNRRRRGGPSVGGPAPTGTSAPAGRSGSPTLIPGSPSGT